MRQDIITCLIWLIEIATIYDKTLRYTLCCMTPTGSKMSSMLNAKIRARPVHTRSAAGFGAESLLYGCAALQQLRGILCRERCRQ